MLSRACCAAFPLIAAGEGYSVSAQGLLTAVASVSESAGSGVAWGLAVPQHVGCSWIRDLIHLGSGVFFIGGCTHYH